MLAMQRMMRDAVHQEMFIIFHQLSLARMNFVPDLPLRYITSQGQARSKRRLSTGVGSHGSHEVPVEGIAALEDAFNNCIEALLKYCSLRQRALADAAGWIQW